jgi:endogenous inhibitor of DNA gyrase (YacG/DUF329 family)
LCTMKAKIKCPHCQTLVAWQGNPHRPFCSERCRLIDLACWDDESYRIPDRPQEPSEDRIISDKNE